MDGALTTLRTDELAAAEALADQIGAMAARMENLAVTRMMQGNN